MKEEINFSMNFSVDTPNLEPFFEKVKILSELDKVCKKTTKFDRDVAFIQALRPLLSEKLQHKATEAIRMMPFFSMVPILKKTENTN